MTDGSREKTYKVVPLDCRGGSNDTIVIFGVHLCFSETLAAACRTPLLVRVSWLCNVEGLCDRFAEDRHVVDRTRCEVEQEMLVHIAGTDQCPCRRVSRVVLGVTGISRHSGIPR